MDRLTEKVLGNIQLKACGNDFCKETCTEHDEEKSCDNCPIQKAFEKLAEYEDLEEQGKLLKMPCAVGDTVYVVMTYLGYVEEIVITGFSVASNVIFMMCDEETGYREDLFGKTIFLTRQEAEDKLAEMEGKNGN